MKVFTVPTEAEGQRLDRWLAVHLKISRSRIQQLIRQGFVTVDGRPGKPSSPLAAGARVEVHTPATVSRGLEPERLELSILYEDEDLVVVDKPSGLVVYPGAGNTRGTLLQGLLHGRTLASVGAPERPGVVHRLDKETSGAIVFAKSDLAYYELIRQFKERQVEKIYLALVHGWVRGDRGIVEAPIGRARHERRRMEVRCWGGRPATTEWRVLVRLREATLLLVRPQTGRTHQIRVHLTSIGHPIVGDPLYGRKNRTPPAPRMMLHAWKLRLTHPRTGQSLEFTAPLPAPFQPYMAGISGPEGN